LLSSNATPPIKAASLGATADVPILVDIFAGIFFVLSSGLIYNERHRKNPWLVGFAGVIAIVSTISLAYSGVSVFGGRMSSRPAPSSEAAPTSSSNSDGSTAAQEAAQAQAEATAAANAALQPSTSPSATSPTPMTSDQTPTASPSAPGVQSMAPPRPLPAPNPTYKAYFDKAINAGAAGDDDTAFADYNLAEKYQTDPYDPSLYVYRGLVQERPGHYEGSLKDCRKVDNAQDRSRLSQQDLSVLDGCMGWNLVKVGDYKASLPYLDRAISRDASKILYRDRAEARSHVGDWKGAASDKLMAALYR
jgi:tetratricopeptide (TPR) repeat protein